MDYEEKNVKALSGEYQTAYWSMRRKARIGCNGVLVISTADMRRLFKMTKEETLEFLYELCLHEVVRKILSVEPIEDELLIKVLGNFSDRDLVIEKLRNLLGEESEDDILLMDLNSILQEFSEEFELIELLKAVCNGDVQCSGGHKFIKEDGVTVGCIEFRLRGK